MIHESQHIHQFPFFNFLHFSSSRYQKDFIQKSLLGKGGFGKVFKGMGK
jgi:hypothetical protein